MSNNQSDDRYRALFASTDEGFCVIEVLFDDNARPTDYRFLEVNPAFERHTGLTDATGKRMRQLASEHEQHWFDTYGQVALTGTPVRFINEARALGRWFDVNAFRIGPPRLHHVGVLFRDITDQKRAEAERDRLRASLSLEQARVAAVVEQAPAFMAVLRGPTHIFELANERYYQLIGHREILGKPVREALPEVEGQGFFELLDQVYASGKPFLGRDVPARIRRQPGQALEERFVEFVFQPLRAADGAVSGVLVHGIDQTERHRAEDALRENERLYRLMVENTRDYAMFITDQQRRVSRWNVGAERLLGWSEQEILGQPADLIFTPEDRAARQPEKEMETALRAGHAADERWHQRKDGVRFYGSGMMMRVDDERGRVVGFTKIMRDETQRRRAEDALRESEQRFRQLADAMPQNVWTAQPDGAPDYFNRRWYQYTGLPEGTTGNAAWEPPMHPDDLPRIRAAWAESVRTGQPFEIQFRVRRASDGAYRWHLARALPVHDANSQISRWFGTITDIDDQKRATQMLAHATARAQRNAAELEALVESMPHAVYFGNESGITRCNRLALKMLGASSPADLQARIGELGVKFRVSYRDDPERIVDHDDLPFARALRGEPASLDTWVTRLGDGARVCVRGTSAPVYENGRIVGAVAVNTDITDQVRAEDAIRESRDASEAANRAKDRFLAALSHELRTPLTPVAMAATAMEMDPALPFEFREDVTMIRRNIELETRLIDDLLDLSRVMTGKLRLNRQPTHLHDAIRHAIETIGPELTEKQLRLATIYGARNDLVDADAARLQQLLWNLLKNAGKFTPPGGRVSVSTRDDPAENAVVVEVQDTGRGIAPEALPHIFNAFEQGGDEVTRRYGGMGLGLAICKAVADLHGGSIRANSAGEGKGATFAVTLPLHKNATDVPAPAPHAPELAPGRPLRLLLVEDHLDTAKTLARLLRRFGFDVRTAGSVNAALEIASSDPFDVLLSDLGLPDGTGYDLLERLRRQRPVIGIAMSGYGMEEDLRRSRAAGFVEHLIKPIDLAQLRDAIRRAERHLPPTTSPMNSTSFSSTGIPGEASG